MSNLKDEKRGKAPEHFMIAGSQSLDTEQIYKFI